MYAINRLFFIVVCFVLVGSTSGVASAQAKNGCSVEVSLEAWGKIVNATELETVVDYYRQLEKCLPVDRVLQSKVDDTAIIFINNMEMLKEGAPRESVSLIIEKFLLLNASVGNPSSQHNYAALHNARPGGLLSRLFKQDYAIFSYWTRRAAAQGEPRSVYNLAIRMVSDKQVGGIPLTPEIAYGHL